MFCPQFNLSLGFLGLWAWLVMGPLKLNYIGAPSPSIYVRRNWGHPFAFTSGCIDHAYMLRLVVNTWVLFPRILLHAFRTCLRSLSAL